MKQLLTLSTRELQVVIGALGYIITELEKEIEVRDARPIELLPPCPICGVEHEQTLFNMDIKCCGYLWCGDGNGWCKEASLE